MSLVMLALSIFLLSARYDLPDYQGEHDLLVYYESIDIFVPFALYCLVPAFILLYVTSYLRNGKAPECLKKLEVVECFIGGKLSMVISKTVLWLKS